MTDTFKNATGPDVPGQSTRELIETMRLHPQTAALINRFAFALACKLAKAEVKYGYTDGWRDEEWEAECRAQLVAHIAKGDPLDVAAYCAFMFHHQWSTAPQPGDDANQIDSFLGEVRVEIVRARSKFPGDRIMTIALAEEFGELAKAILDEPAANVRKEAVQTATMAARVVLDGDGSVAEWRAARGLDPLVAASAPTCATPPSEGA